VDNEPSKLLIWQWCAAGRPPQVTGREMSIAQDFKAFAMRGNAIDLAVGVVIGAAFAVIIASLVKDIITPPLGLLFGGLDFSNMFVVLRGDAAYPTLKAAQDAGAVTLNYGLFINAILNFLLVALALFLLIRWINRITVRKAVPAAAAPLPSEETQLLRDIRDTLKARV
jgi:large conductance mechanosensitive channel